MPIYTAKMPFHITQEDIEALRGLGSIEFVFSIEAPSREDAMRELDAEFEWRGFNKEWWRERLSGGRKRLDAANG